MSGRLKFQSGVSNEVEVFTTSTSQRPCRGPSFYSGEIQVEDDENAFEWEYGYQIRCSNVIWNWQL